jgi:hypothetical protein
MKKYITNLKGFYKTKRDSLLQSYQKLPSNVLGVEPTLPFELFVIALCEDEHSEELYNWVEDNWRSIATNYIDGGMMKPSVRETYGVKSDLFIYILWCYTQSQLQPNQFKFLTTSK